MITPEHIESLARRAFGAGARIEFDSGHLYAVEIQTYTATTTREVSHEIANGRDEAACLDEARDVLEAEIEKRAAEPMRRLAEETLRELWSVEARVTVDPTFKPSQPWEVVASCKGRKPEYSYGATPAAALAAMIDELADGHAKRARTLRDVLRRIEALAAGKAAA